MTQQPLKFRRDLTQQEIDGILEQRRQGKTNKQVADYFGASIHTVKNLCNVHGLFTQAESTVRSVDSQAMRLKRQIPKDTRTFTSRLFGDPLPGRSALDRYQSAYGLSQTEGQS